MDGILLAHRKEAGGPPPHGELSPALSLTCSSSPAPNLGNATVVSVASDGLGGLTLPQANLGKSFSGVQAAPHSMAAPERGGDLLKNTGLPDWQKPKSLESSVTEEAMGIQVHALILCSWKTRQEVCYEITCKRRVLLSDQSKMQNGIHFCIFKKK